MNNKNSPKTRVFSVFVGCLAIIGIPANSMAYARYGAHASKTALMHSPNWVIIVIGSAAAIFLTSILMDIHKDSSDVTDSKQKRDMNLMKLYFLAGIVASLWLVLDAAFG